MLFEILTAVFGLAVLLCYLLRKPPRLWTLEDMKTQASAYRKLGGYEEMMARLAKKGECNMTTAVFIRSKFLLTEVMVRRALTALSLRHPLLRMRLGGGNRHFTFMKEMKKFRVDLEVCHTKDWQGVMLDQLPKIYDAEKGPLWKVKFMPETSYADGEEDYYPYQAAFIFAFHHVIIDGQSFLRLFGELVDKLHEILENDEQPVESKPLLPPVDAYIDAAKIYTAKYNLKANISHIFGMLTLVPQLLNLWLEATSKPALFVTKLGVEIMRNPNAAKKTGFILAELTRKQTSELLACCKKYKTTVQCAIQTAACLAYSRILDGGKVTQTYDINCYLSCNLRRFLASNELTDYFGMYISLFGMNTRIEPVMSFWEIVSEVSEVLQSELKSNAPFLFYPLLTKIANSNDATDPFNKARANFPGQRSMDLGFHNYGNYNFLNRNETSHAKLTGFFASGNAIDQGSVFENVLATVNGKLSWTFNYCSHICSKEQAQEYADMTIDTLLKALTEEHM